MEKTLSERMVEYIDIITDINEEIILEAEKKKQELVFTLVPEIYGYYDIVVNFLGQSIWNSDEDERHFDHQLNDYEPLTPFLIQAMKKQMEDIIIPSEITVVK
jgi:cysteinyl-tRNA synthetase